MKHIQHLPAQQEDRKQNHQHRHQFAETHASPRGFEFPGSQVKNIERCKAEYDRPKNAVDIAAGGTVLENRSESNCHRYLSMHSLPGGQCSAGGANIARKQRFGSEKAHNKYPPAIIRKPRFGKPRFSEQPSLDIIVFLPVRSRLHVPGHRYDQVPPGNMNLWPFPARSSSM